MPSHVVARVPGKINLQLSVGPLQRDGYHPVATVFQAVSIFDDVKVAFSSRAGITILSGGKPSDYLPLDKNNLAYKAAELMMKKFDITDGLEITLTKEIPIAGGMAGGSADAGATIVGLYKNRKGQPLDRVGGLVKRRLEQMHRFCNMKA